MVSDAPERIWLSAADGDNEREVWTDPDEGGTEYRRADIAERERDHWEKGCRDAFASKNRWRARATAAEAAIARLRDEVIEKRQRIETLSYEDAGEPVKWRDIRRAFTAIFDGLVYDELGRWVPRAALRALNRDTHHETR